MKKILILLVVVSAMLASCSKDDDKSKVHSLSGTTWTRSITNGVSVLEFTGSNSVRYYQTNTNGDINSLIATGSYTVNDDKVTFNGLSFMLSPQGMNALYWDYGLINGDIITAYQGTSQYSFKRK